MNAALILSKADYCLNRVIMSGRVVKVMDLRIKVAISRF